MAARANGSQDQPGWTGFLQLPPEITEHIATFCEHNELRALRLVNRDVESRVLRPFTSYFEEPVVLLSQEPSLQTLCRIAEHTKFGKAIKSIMLSTCELPQPDDHGRLLRLQRHPPSLFETPSLEDQYKREAQEEMYKRLLARQSDFRETRKDIQLLTSIFSLLKTVSNGTLTISIRDTTTFRGIRDTWAQRAIESATGEVFDDPSVSETPICTVLEALSESGLQICSFDVDYDYWESFCLSTRQARDHAKSVFASLRRLSLGNVYQEDHDGGEGWYPEPSTYTLEVLAAAHVLESIALYANCGASERMTATKFPSLRLLDLVALVLDYEALSRFIAQNDTLQTVDVRGCHFLGAVDLERLPGEYSKPDKVAQHDVVLTALFRNLTALENICIQECTVRAWESDPEKWT
ncbi:uncharacterized protein LTR77_009992 [Saxophila tyrrhenica]|uniref:F-box domain-containing protein n=1 Tax=Saxophila tyrrhenica TaxID=1690608 RepID=A0AAV9NZE3_9PEZI|nr:hypothetical protein LTR77_009992 [Saxophila tyrrhenica]